MVPPPLKLVMVKGPRAGENLEFRPGSTIRIGWVVRGNNVTIKDAGISSKHLIIGSESGKWIVQDLDSSNGTTLNSSKLPPFASFDLHNRDSVKIGECTSILVQFNNGDEPSQLHRNLRRKGSNLEGKDQKSELEEPVEENRRRGRTRRARVLEIDKEKEKESENGESERANSRVMQSRRNDDCVILEAECGKRTRGGRGRRKNLQELPLEENAQTGVVGNKDSTEDKDTECEIIEVKGTAREAKTSENFGGELDLENAQARVIGNKDGVEYKDSECEIVGDKERDGEAKAKVKVSANLGEELDLEKMTLGKWFDYMEVNLPKQINEATQEMIVGMRRKAERVKEYIIEQKKSKAMMNAVG